MKKFSFLFLPVLAIFPSLVSACGSHEEEISQNTSLIGFGLMGGFFGSFIQLLIVVALGLLITLFIKKLRGKNERGFVNKNG